MPRQIFHLKIGNLYVKNHISYNKPEFYLGCISPDSIKAYGYVTDEEKIKSHLKDTNIEKWKNNVINFYETTRNEENKEFILGYVIHMLTDILYDDKYGKQIKQKLKEKGINEKELQNEFTEQMRKYEISQLDEPWWKDAKENLKVSQLFEINNIPVNTIKDWRDKVIVDYEKKLISNSLINEKLIDEKLLMEMTNDLNKIINLK